MKKLIILFLISISFFFNLAQAKKEKPILIITSKKPELSKSVLGDVKSEFYLKRNSKIYFIVYTKEGFKSDYIKYQIVQQNNNAHVGGFTRVRNITARVKNKNYFQDYFQISMPGKYYLQVFDIENLQQWITMGEFRVIND